MTKNVSITGASGFIGSWLVRKLNREAFVVPHLISHEEIIYGHSYECDAMFFLSTYGNMSHHKNHAKMIKANVDDLLTIIRRHFNGWLCYMSSSSVTLSVQTPYSRSKRAAEEILQALPELKSCIVRPYSVTGVGEQKEHLIPTLIRSCFTSEEMTFDPSPTHDFIDVQDVVDALIRLADDQATGIYEFGNRIAISNEEVRRLVEEVTGLKANITNVKPMREYDSEDWCCKTQNKYWQPTKSLRQSVTEMVEQYRNEQR